MVRWGLRSESLTDLNTGLPLGKALFPFCSLSCTKFALRTRQQQPTGLNRATMMPVVKDAPCQCSPPYSGPAQVELQLLKKCGPKEWICTHFPALINRGCVQKGQILLCTVCACIVYGTIWVCMHEWIWTRILFQLALKSLRRIIIFRVCWPMTTVKSVCPCCLLS